MEERGRERGRERKLWWRREVEKGGERHKCGGGER